MSKIQNSLSDWWILSFEFPFHMIHTIRHSQPAKDLVRTCTGGLITGAIDNAQLRWRISENQTFLGMKTLKIRSKQLYNDCNSPPQARKNGNLEENQFFFQEILAHPKPSPRVGGSSQILGMKTYY